jgi:hypothetical protein
MVLEAVEKQREFFSNVLSGARDRAWTYVLIEDNERRAVRRPRAEVNDRTYGLVHVCEAE